MKYLLYILFVLLFSISVFGADAFNLPQNSGELSIATPKFLYLAENNLNTLTFQVYNKSGILLDNSSILCYLSLQNQTELLLDNENINYRSPNIWEKNISLSSGYFSYIISCGNGSVGGFYSSGVEVLEGYNLLPISKDGSIFVISLIVLLLVVAFAFILITQLSGNYIWYIFASVWLIATGPLLSRLLLSLDGLFSYLGLGFFYLCALVLVYFAVEQIIKNVKGSDD